MTEQELANVIWDIKEVIRNYYDDSEVEDGYFAFHLASSFGLCPRR